MTKKYNLILSDMGNWYCVAYVKDVNGNFYASQILDTKRLNKPYAQFTQAEIDDLKANLHTKALRDVVDASKVEVKEPLYYTQSKRTDKYGCRFFFVFEDEESLESTDVWRQTSIENLLDKDCISNHSLLRPKSEWKPYLTPDRELVRYEPKEDEND